MTKILYILNIPSPYRVDYFNELGKQSELTVLFEKKTSDERDVSWSQYEIKTFTAHFMKGIKVKTDSSLSLDPIRFLKRHPFEIIICCDYYTPTGMLAVQYMKNHGIPYWIEADGAFPGSGKGIKEKIKRHFISGADGYFSTAKENDAYFLQYGALESRIHRYYFSSVFASKVIKYPVIKNEKMRLRNKHGIKEKKVVLAIGQFIYRKGFDLLLRASAKFDDDTAVVFVGGRPTDEYKQLAASSNAKIYFEGFKTGDDLVEYYCMADVFCLPTREDIWGLVVNEAMACGLPVVTTTRCNAGLEMVEEGKCGYVIPVDDEAGLSNALKKILDDEELQNNMSEQAIKTAEQYTIEAMVASHMHYWRDNM